MHKFKTCSDLKTRNCYSFTHAVPSPSGSLGCIAGEKWLTADFEKPVYPVNKNLFKTHRETDTKPHKPYTECSGDHVLINCLKYTMNTHKIQIKTNGPGPTQKKTEKCTAKKKKVAFLF